MSPNDLAHPLVRSAGGVGVEVVGCYLMELQI